MTLEYGDGRTNWVSLPKFELYTIMHRIHYLKIEDVDEAIVRNKVICAQTVWAENCPPQAGDFSEIYSILSRFVDGRSC